MPPHDIIRRLVLCPLFLVALPVVYLIARCVAGREAAGSDMREILRDLWNGVED